MPEKKNKLLLHVCCIGCGAYVAEALRADYEPVLFFYNPNIHPPEEYARRLAETERIAGELKLKLIIGDNNHAAWLEDIKGLESEPEKGRRCWRCYEYRLAKTAASARQAGLAVFASTLTVSPHKDAGAISALGRRLALAYGLDFLDQDFKKRDGFKKACALSRELGLYRQDYCGCEFSVF